MNILVAFLLVALGIGVDAFYQHKIRVAECDAYETGYQQGQTEEQIKLAMLREYAKALTMSDAINAANQSMAAPVEMPPTFEERMRKHGRAVVKLK